MTHIEIAKAAVAHGQQFRGTLSDNLCRELAYAQVARWLYGQDDSVLPAAAKTATAAIACIGATWP